MKIIIDTDPGHDDALALIMAGKSDGVEIMAVTTVAGNSTIQNTTKNARYVLDYIGRNDVAVFSGESKPMKRDLVQAVVHGSSGLQGANIKNMPTLSNDAPEQMIRIIEDNPGEVTVVALGPLTNIANAIRKKPSVINKVKQIVFMGGAIGVPGNKNRVAEFNIFVDPEAANIVMQSSVPKVMVPLDACNNIQVSLADFARVRDIKLRKFLIGIMTPYIANIAKDIGVQAGLVYDPLAVFCLLCPGSCETKKYNILIETKSELTRGMTVADRRNVTDGLEPNVTVVTKINESDFFRKFFRSLNN